MIPTLQQLDRWLDAHNMSATISRDDVAVTLREPAPSTRISHHVTWRWVDKTINEAEALNQACAIMARECCITPPLIAHHLAK